MVCSLLSSSKLISIFIRLGTTGVLNRPVESLSMIKGFSTKATVPIGLVALGNLDSSRKTSCCARCMHNYEQELEKLVANELDKPSSVLKLEGGKALPLPLWLQNAKAEDEHSKKHEATIEVNSIVILC